jgi:hypothetical protein
MFDVLEPSVALIATFYLPGNRSTISEMGQTRRSDRAPFTSGLPRKADKFRACWHFAFVPTTEVTLADA